MPPPHRPDFIDQFYELVRPIAEIESRINVLTDRGIALAEADRTDEAAAVLAQCEALQAERRRHEATYESFLLARGLLQDED
jgi:hypothetical protein